MSNNSNFSLNAFTKIEDIIYLDEPILSHLKLNEKDYLLYLVDNFDNFDRYLLFEILEEDLMKYLTKNLSLKKLILKNNFLFQIDENYEGEIVDYNYVLTELVDKKYFPIENSYLEYNPTAESFYYKKIQEYHKKAYLYSLRQSAFYLKFSTNSEKYGDTIGLRELTNILLTNISSSFKNFVEIDFHKNFDNKITDNIKLKKILRTILPDTDLRMVDLNYGSFEIGLASDKLMKSNIEDKDVKIWANNIGDNYKKIVLDDKIDENELNGIIEKYSDEERSKIFTPIINIVNDPNYSLKIKDKKTEKFNNLGVKKKSVSEKLVVKKIIKELPIEKNLELIQVTTVIDKNSKKKTISLDNTLFNVVNKSSVILFYKDFENRGYKNVNQNIQISVEIENIDNHINLHAIYDSENFNITIDNEKIEDGIKKMMDKVYEFILNNS